MNQGNYNWFINIARKAKYNLNLPDNVEMIMPGIFVEEILDKETVMVRWWEEKEETQKEFSLIVPLDFIVKNLATNPWSSNVWFLGPLEKLEEQSYRKEGFHLEYYSKENPFVVVGEMMGLRFIFGVCHIIDRDQKIYKPLLYKSPQFSWQ